MVVLRVSAPWLIVIFSCVVLANCELEEYFKWKQITFASLQRDGDDILFPDMRMPMLNQGYQNNGNYIPTNNVPMGATHYKGKIIMAIPRRRAGVPSTLNFIYTKSTKGSSPSFKAFPNDEMNALHPFLQPDPNRIISVYRTRVDECNRLWWIDTGMLEYPDNTVQIQRPSIWAYDLERDVVVHRFEIPESIVQRGIGMASVTIDVNPNNCQDAYAYIPDLAAYGLYVYSLRRNHIWAFRHNFFHFDPLHGDFHVAGVDYQWDDGIFSITLGNREPDGFRTVFFHPMVSISEFAVSSRILQNEQMSSRPYHGNDFMYLGSRGPNTQSAMHDFDRTTGVIFYSQVGINGLACWNPNSQHTPHNFDLLAKDNRTMIYPTDVNVDSDGTLWMLTNTMPRFIYAQLDWNEYNFRLWRASTIDLIKNSVCRGY